MRKLQMQIADWLHQLKIPVSDTYLRTQFLSHPDYPSLAAITDVLDDLNIENTAIQIEKEQLHELPVPFLAYLRSNGGEFVMVKNRNDLGKQFPKFFERWSGVVVLAEKKDNWIHNENSAWLIKEKRQRQFLWLTTASLMIISVLSLWGQFSWQYFALLISSLAGLGVAVLIVQRELGINNEFTEQLCAAGKNTDCDAVMQSKGSKFLGWFNWADSGIIYFSSVFLLLTVSFFTETGQAFLIILSLLASCALLFTFFSVYYQWRIVKKWCPLCLTIVGLLWIQFIILLPVTLGLMTGNWEFFSINIGLFTIFVLLVIAAVWMQLVKPSLQKNKELTDKNFQMLRFKNNSDVFNSLLQQQRKIDTTSLENDLQLGNPNANLQIIVACSPYCGPCAKAHDELHKLAEKNDIGLTVRFTVKAGVKEDKKTKAADYILQLVTGRTNDYKKQVLHKWYAEMNFEKFEQQYSLKEKHNVDDLLRQQEQWAEEANIIFTPTIFINGYEMPKQYEINELAFITKKIMLNMNNEETLIADNKTARAELAL